MHRAQLCAGGRRIGLAHHNQKTAAFLFLLIVLPVQNAFANTTPSGTHRLADREREFVLRSTLPRPAFAKASGIR
ncbi:MAG: hypothetical protein IPJ87_13795 [Flavobacteriales bacterium]|nr:hypothetical protein [Flavobacteriales bacterium]MBK7942924.1 hypothetical protein [Flavobacteriales bacterium]MBK8948982.1 hypothetical protein [Flavobacteriales bacterium]MBK9698676.1 hypothetical protein [Flavobacteriales bacterium]